jgi:flavoprotein
MPVNSKRIEFRAEYCVGCQKCVQMYPEYFSVNEIVEIFIRTTDKVITRKLSEEFTVFLSPSEITDFIKIT